MTVEGILREAREAVAGGAEPDWKSLRDRLRGAAPDEAARRRALVQLERIGAVHRARRTTPTAAPAPRPAAPRVAALRTRPSLSGDLDVRRERQGEAWLLAWPPRPAVERWEVRIAARTGARGDYEAVESLELPGTATSVELPLGETPLRVHVLGRSRGGRLVQRAIASGLTPDSWGERWQRRPS
jgi:hypothetical protein